MQIHHPRHYAETTPNKIAATFLPSGLQLTYLELEHRANQTAHLFRDLGLSAGDVAAVWLKNVPEYLILYAAAQRSGIRFCPIATHLTLDEVDYIVNNSGAKLLVTHFDVPHAEKLTRQFKANDILSGRVFSIDRDDDLPNWNSLVSQYFNTPIADETAGLHMVYSSGTTGRPKGVKINPVDADIAIPGPVIGIIARYYGADSETVYLSPAPLYHTAPLVYCTSLSWFGAHVIVMERFDPELYLETVEAYGVTMSQVVPTMFIRMLKLPVSVRNAFDISSLKYVIHAAAPCPVETKHRMLEWFGDIIYEYYAGSEGNGSTAITPQEWKQKPGSVGRPNWGEVHICDETGHELNAGEQGVIYFGGGLTFEYLNDSQKTDDSRNPLHPEWTTLGDIGYVDEDGYLFLTDRRSNMIISGGVNIYPQETENHLIQHPAIRDIAVIGLPDPEMGERVAAFVALENPEDATEQMAHDLMAFCRASISHVKCPVEIRFVDDLPRTESGKLLKRRLT